MASAMPSTAARVPPALRPTFQPSNAMNSTFGPGAACASAMLAANCGIGEPMALIDQEAVHVGRDRDGAADRQQRQRQEVAEQRQPVGPGQGQGQGHRVPGGTRPRPWRAGPGRAEPRPAAAGECAIATKLAAPELRSTRLAHRISLQRRNQLESGRGDQAGRHRPHAAQGTLRAG